MTLNMGVRINLSFCTMTLNMGVRINLSFWSDQTPASVATLPPTQNTSLNCLHRHNYTGHITNKSRAGGGRDSLY